MKEETVEFKSHKLKNGTIIIEIPTDEYYILAETASAVLLADFEKVGVSKKSSNKDMYEKIDISPEISDDTCSCGGKLKKQTIDCPDNKVGCLVLHYGFVCLNCGKIYQNEAKKKKLL